MEVRTITQGKVYYLIMNPVTDRAETGRITVMSDTKQKLIDFYNEQHVPVYDDGNFRKVFKQGGPLEWYNPVWTFDGLDTFGHGIHTDWIDLDNLSYVKEKYYFI